MKQKGCPPISTPSGNTQTTPNRTKPYHTKPHQTIPHVFPRNWLDVMPVTEITMDLPKAL